MRLPRLLFLSAAVLAVASAVRANDTKDFLDPANWEGRTDLWKVEKGSIVGETTEDPKYNTFLVSKKKYGDFELSFKVTLRDGVGNSGVQIRSAVADPKKFVVGGPQVDVGKGYFGSLYGERVGGMMQAAPKEVVSGAKLDGTNEYHVIAKGNHITIKVNGQTAVDADFPNTPDKKPLAADGVIAFQVHAGYPKMRVEYSDIKFVDNSKK